MKSTFLTIGAWLVAALGSVPLFSVLYMLIVKGGARLTTALFTELPPAGFELGGGIGNAIEGTVVTVAIASAISIPLSLLVAIYLAEFRPHGKIAVLAHFLSKVLTGFPSILAGVFVYGAVVLLMGSYSALAGGTALAVLMLPTVTLTAESAMQMVPRRMKDAAIGMGCTNAQVVWSVTLPTALPSIITGVILAVARVAGERDGVDIFAMGQLRYWLELNAVVLCGNEAAVRSAHHRLIEATTTRFYEQPDGGIRDIMDWYGLNRGKGVWRRAAGVFIRILSDPQLFIEGNHRTGALIMSICSRVKTAHRSFSPPRTRVNFSIPPQHSKKQKNAAYRCSSRCLD